MSTQDILDDFESRFPSENLPRHVVKEFILVVLAQQERRHKEGMREVLEEIKNSPKTLLEETENFDTYEEGYEQCLDDVVDIINKKLGL